MTVATAVCVLSLLSGVLPLSGVECLAVSAVIFTVAYRGRWATVLATVGTRRR